jgi:hypothetical protein
MAVSVKTLEELKRQKGLKRRGSLALGRLKVRAGKTRREEPR